jgi:hypothetical protein
MVTVIFGLLVIYTFLVVPTHGLNFVPTFLGDLMAFDWRGHINLDFISYLAITAFWVAWRHRFSAGGIVMSVCVFFGATLIFAPYLLYAISKSKGDMAALLLGDHC